MIAEDKSTLLAGIDDHELLATRALYDQWVRENVDMRDRVDMEIQRRLTDRNATAIFDEDYTCTLETGTPTVDLGIMAGLKELLPPEILAEGYTPEHQEPVAERWDLRKVNVWSKAGGEVARVIEEAKIPGRPRLVVKEKKAT